MKCQRETVKNEKSNPSYWMNKDKGYQRLLDEAGSKSSRGYDTQQRESAEAQRIRLLKLLALPTHFGLGNLVEDTNNEPKPIVQTDYKERKTDDAESSNLGAGLDRLDTNIVLDEREEEKANYSGSERYSDDFDNLSEEGEESAPPIGIIPHSEPLSKVIIKFPTRSKVQDQVDISTLKDIYKDATINADRESISQSKDITGTACWNWALTGGISEAGINVLNSPIHIYDKIIQHDTSLEACPVTNINTEDTLFELMQQDPDKNVKAAGIQSQSLAMKLKGLLSKIQKGDNKGEEFIDTAMQLVAVTNGLKPNEKGENSTYTLHMTGKTFGDWSHWGIGVKLGNKRAIFQILPAMKHVGYSDHLWDAPDFGPGHVIGIDQLHDAQLSILKFTNEKLTWL